MKNLNNEKIFLESLFNKDDKIYNIQGQIKEQFNTNSFFDKKESVLYIWNENEDNIQLIAAKNYITENFDMQFIDIDMNKCPDELLAESNDEQNVYVVYLDDGTMYNYYYDKDDADKVKEKLDKESPINKPKIKQEPISNFIKND